jgi:hypothetical protein
MAVRVRLCGIKKLFEMTLRLSPHDPETESPPVKATKLNGDVDGIS